MAGCVRVQATGCTDPQIVNDGSKYDYYVIAYNSEYDVTPAGHSSDQSAHQSITAAGTPDTPRISKITPADGKLTVSYTRGASHGSESSTVIKCTISPGGACGGWNTGAGAGTSQQTITGLKNGTAYSISLQLCNGATGNIGSAKACSNTSAAMSGTPYGAIKVPKISASISDQTVTWSASWDANGKPAQVKITADNNGTLYSSTSGNTTGSMSGHFNIAYSSSTTLHITLSDSGRASQSASSSKLTAPPPPLTIQVIHDGVHPNGSDCTAGQTCYIVGVIVTNATSPLTCTGTTNAPWPGTWHAQTGIGNGTNNLKWWVSNLDSYYVKVTCSNNTQSASDTYADW